MARAGVWLANQCIVSQCMRFVVALRTCAPLLLVLALAVTHAPALAQADPPEPPDVTDAQPAAEEAESDLVELGPGVRRMRGTTDKEMIVRLEQFGLGGVARVGDWTAIRVAITDKGSQARNVVVRVAAPDSDGDIAQQQREIATNPGTSVAVWMYIRLPFADVPINISVLESLDAESSTDPSELRVRTGSLLGGITLRPSETGGGIAYESESLIGLLGQQPIGLQQYGNRLMQKPVAENGNEVSKIITGIKPMDLPDRWMGLANLDVLIWGGPEDPLELQRSAMRAEAIKDWIKRGGHLVVVLPSVGQMWTDPQNPLASLMPDVTVERRENASMAPFKPLLTTPLERADPFPANATVHVLSPNAAAAEGTALPILTGPNGEVLAVRRLVGTGAVTVIGLDLNHPGIRSRVYADVFWHRILGRTGDLAPAQGRTTAATPGLMMDSSWYVDGTVPQLTNVLGKSAIGALAAFLLFALYWLCVGPPLFWTLRKQAKHHQSWLFFMLGVAGFSLIAWISATALRPRNAAATVFMLLDHVYASEVGEGIPQQRARVWANVLIPRYGAARVSVGSPMGDDKDSLSSLAAFDAPEAEGRIGGFPDTRGYPIDTLSPDAATMPSRATVKSLTADWAGSPVWAMPLPVALTEGADPKLKLVPQVIQGDGTTPTRVNTNVMIPVGTLEHKMPAALQNITVVLVRGQSRVRGAPADFDPVGVAVTMPSDFKWNPGEQLNLDQVFTVTGKSDSLRAAINSLADMRSSSSDPASMVQQMMTMSFMHLLPPVDRSNSRFGSGVRVAQRRITHGLDLSRWTTQPCIIIFGAVQMPLGRQSPVPIYLDGESLPTQGMVVVRWIYPLPADPPTFADSAKQQSPRPSEREQRKDEPEK